MNPVIDQMLALTADIAEELLLIKDAERDTLPDGLKLKIISLAELAATSDGAQPQEDTAVEENVAVTEDDAAEIENAEFEEEADADVNLAEENVEEIEQLPSSEPVAQSMEQPEEQHEAGEIPISQVDKESYEEDKELSDAEPEITPESDSEPVEEPEPVPESEPEIVPAPGPEPEPTPESTSIQAIVEEVETPRRNISPTDIYRTFSINDAFFYRREIFGGSRQQMMESLVQISMLPDRAALREYLVERLGLNLDETPGKEFYQSLEALL